MNFKYLALYVFLIKNASSYNPSRQPRLADAKTTRRSEEGNSSSKKIKSKSNYDQAVPKSTHLDFFPEVEYPSSIIDASKPFYLNMNPFSQDVKASFNNFDSQKTTTKPTVVLNLIPKGNKKNKKPTLKLVDSKSKIVELTLKSNKSKENITEVPILLEYEIDNSSLHDPELIKSIVKSEVSIEQVTKFDEFISLTDTETGVVNNSVSQLLITDENPSEIVTIAAGLTSPNNDTDDEFDKYLSIELEPLLFYSPNLTTIASDYDNCIAEDSLINSEQYSYESLED